MNSHQNIVSKHAVYVYINAVFLRMLYHVRNSGETTSFIARRATLWVCLSYIVYSNHAHCTPVKYWYPLVCPHCGFFQLQRTDWNNGQSILHLTKTRLYNIYHYDTCQWSRVITGTQTLFKNKLPILGMLIVVAHGICVCIAGQNLDIKYKRTDALSLWHQQ